MFTVFWFNKQNEFEYFAVLSFKVSEWLFNHAVCKIGLIKKHTPTCLSNIYDSLVAGIWAAERN
jgi:hypothetical protein